MSHPWNSATKTLLPLGRRYPEGADEGAFLTGEVAPHQFGQMTYSCAGKRRLAPRGEHAAVSHGLTSSPPMGEGSDRAAT